MPEDPLEPDGRTGKINTGVRQLASHVLSVLATEANRSQNGRRSKRIVDFCNALIHPDDRRRYDVVAGFIASGITADEIIETYVPEAARLLGEQWVDDKLSFAEVTVGAARLQEIVRAFGARYEQPGALVPLGRSMLMVVPDCERHTLGPFIAASQFRRYGLWVQMAIGMTPAEIGNLVADHHFSLVGISGANRRSINVLENHVKEIRNRLEAPVPVVIGGSIVSAEPDLQAATGADLVTVHPREALRFCGLLPATAEPLPIDQMMGAVDRVT